MPLYRQDELLAASPDLPVYIAEGEAKAKTLHELGLVATSALGGAGRKWDPRYSDLLDNRDLVILPDNDKPGRDHALDIAERSFGKARSVKVLELPGLPEKGDVLNWLQVGHTVEELMELVSAAPEWQPPVTAAAPSEPTNEIPQLPDDVFTGWLADFRDWVLPTTDGSIEGIFGAASVQVGVALGRSVSVHYGVPTFANLFVALCGPTGVPRKTTLINRSQSIQDRAFTEDFVRTVRSIGSGEGLLERFCQEVEEGEGRSKRTVLQPIPGQRVLLDEPELTNLLKKIRRPGTANIAEILLGLFDGADYSPSTRRRPIVVEQPFFSIITATTPEALEATLNDVDIDSGLIPRVATFWCSPREPIAWPAPPDQELLTSLASKLQDVAHFAGGLHHQNPVLELSDGARSEWESIYRDLVKESREAPKAVAGIMARVPTMIMKWALLYAVQDFHTVIEVHDLARAAMVGDYLMQSARLVPLHVEKVPLARVESKILEMMSREPGKWWKVSEIHQRVSGRTDATTLRRTLDSLTALGQLEHDNTGTTLIYRAVI